MGWSAGMGGSGWVAVLVAFEEGFDDAAFEEGMRGLEAECCCSEEMEFGEEGLKWVIALVIL